jgi:hypothetical protein
MKFSIDRIYDESKENFLKIDRNLTSSELGEMNGYIDLSNSNINNLDAQLYNNLELRGTNDNINLTFENKKLNEINVKFEGIKLSNNRINKLSKDFFYKCHHIKVLDLSSNKIVALQENLFHNLKSLLIS